MSKNKPKGVTKSLIQGFETGDLPQDAENGLKSPTEKVGSRPGAARKMAALYEQKSQPEAKPVIVSHKSKSAPATVVPKSVAEPPPPPKYNVLIVFAHWEGQSFNGALLQEAVQALEGQGHEVTVSNLYQMEFNPLPSQKDVEGDAVGKEERFRYQAETGKAWECGTLAKDIVVEHAKLNAADLVVFQFPMAWLSFPAMMKGWIDRVFTYSYAYGPDKWYDSGGFKGKKAVLSFTTAGRQSFYSNKGINGDMDVCLWPMQNILRFVGFDVLCPQVHYGVADVGEDGRKAMLTAWAGRLQNIWQESPLNFFPLNAFNEDTMQLNDSVIKELAEGDQYTPTIGQNLAVPLVAGSMSGQSECTAEPTPEPVTVAEEMTPVPETNDEQKQ